MPLESFQTVLIKAPFRSVAVTSCFMSYVTDETDFQVSLACLKSNALNSNFSLSLSFSNWSEMQTKDS